MGLKSLQLIQVEEKRGTSKAGQPYALLVCQGIMHFEDGRQEVFVFEHFPRRKDDPLPQWKPGNYLPVLEPQPNNQTRKLEARIVDLRSIDMVRAPKPQAV